jgi:hypothetical protein
MLEPLDARGYATRQGDRILLESAHPASDRYEGVRQVIAGRLLASQDWPCQEGAKSVAFSDAIRLRAQVPTLRRLGEGP